MESYKLSIKKQARGFRFAFAGIRKFLRQERNAPIHLFATLVVAAAAVYWRVSVAEAIALVFAVSLVWITEMLNTCVEKMMDLVSIEEHPGIAFIKDVAAGAVLIASAAAVLTGLFIFIPKII